MQVDRLRLFWFSLLGFVFTIPLSSFVSVRLMLLVLVLSFFLPGRLRLEALFTRSWDILLYVAVLMLGLIYSSDVERGWRLMETRFSLIAIPLIFWRATHLGDQHMFTIARYFTLGLILACLVCISNASIVYFKTGDASAFLFENLTGIMKTQPTYLAYYLIFSITFGLYSLYYRGQEESRTATVISVLFLFFMLMLTGGKTTFIGLLLIFSFFVLKFILEAKTPQRIIVFGLVAVMLITLFIVNSVEYWSFEGDYWERTVLWQSAINANPSPLFGVGTGDYNIVLNEYFSAHGLTEFADGSYNAHNQFIQGYLTNGFIGLAALLIVLGRPLYMAARNHDTLTILIFFPFLIYGMTEVFLGRYQGVVFFAMVQYISTVLSRRDREEMLPGHA